MPETMFRVRWPDGAVETCYSPSTVIKNYFDVGRSYDLGEFVALCREGLHAASERVRSRYGGSGCSHAMAQLAAIEAKAERQAAEGATVKFEGFGS